MKRLVVDVDDTICRTEGGKYDISVPRDAVVRELHEYRFMGFQIVLHTSRNMRTYDGNIGKINANTLPGLVTWLDRHDVPYDEIHVGKPWCGHDGFYVDDKAIRPSEFVSMSYDEIVTLLEKER
ncbi:capsular biosynthesis protein [Alcanivorax sp. JB21]|uniref:capsular biosynthesis protein n=1 Tax=Alcanivorax limicola TaxID=2874102 RepID=UPI001CBEC8F8|nr:capsular biosynthesis protein [Alcanivorax limicola]MBZ2190301.1 capsular biosynthesis protein [Alcanivorax limicola]